MRYAVIAAGEGSRLRQEGVTEPKPLVKIGGECLIDRLLRVFMQNGAEEIWVVCNDRWPGCGAASATRAARGSRGAKHTIELYGEEHSKFYAQLL